jgi:hypothetical protein
MVLRKAADQQSSLEARFDRRRFTRRADLTNNIRLTIAANALHAMMCPTRRSTGSRGGCISRRERGRSWGR